MTEAGFAFEVPPDADPAMRAVALLGEGLDELRAAVEALWQQHTELRELVAADGPGMKAAGVPRRLRWADLDRADASAAWVWLIRWVARLVDRFQLDEELPCCWPQHPALVEELTGLCASWHVAYADGAHPDLPVRWLEVFARARVRLREWDDHTRCRNGTHTARSVDMPWPDDWAQHAYDHAETDVNARPKPGPTADRNHDEDRAEGTGS